MSLACLVCQVDSPTHSFRSYSVSSSDNEGRCTAIVNCLIRNASYLTPAANSSIASSSKVTPQPTTLSNGIPGGPPRLVRSHAVRRDLVQDWNFDEVVVGHQFRSSGWQRALVRWRIDLLTCFCFSFFWFGCNFKAFLLDSVLFFGLGANLNPPFLLQEFGVLFNIGSTTGYNPVQHEAHGQLILSQVKPFVILLVKSGTQLLPCPGRVDSTRGFSSNYTIIKKFFSFFSFYSH